MRLTKKTVFIGIASLLILGLAAWGVNAFLVMNNAQQSFDKNFIHFQAKSDDNETFITQGIGKKEVYNLSYSPDQKTIEITKSTKNGDIYSSDSIYGAVKVYDIKQNGNSYVFITAAKPIIVDFGLTSVRVTYDGGNFETPYSELHFGESFPSEDN